jgi:hypothetical protein
MAHSLFFHWLKDAQSLHLFENEKIPANLHQSHICWNIVESVSNIGLNFCAMLAFDPNSHQLYDQHISLMRQIS